MSIVEAVVLGIFQGLTEFLPISSTAHLRVIPAFFGWDDPGAAFTAVTQLGTMAAVLLYFWRDIVRIVWTWVRSLWTPELRGHIDARLGWYVGLGTIPIGVCGLVFSDQVETVARNMWVIAAALVGFGVLLLVSDRVTKQQRGMEDLSLRDGVIIGLWQALALIPGVSRSGATITGALFLSYDRKAAARYSFLLSVPAVVLSGAYEMRDIGEVGVPSPVPTLIATVIAFVVAYATIGWMLRFVERHSMMFFVIWRVVLGVVIVGMLAGGLVDATS